MKHGKGHYQWADGSYYNGEWAENQIEGKVLYQIVIDFREHMFGLMVDNMMVNGKLIICTGREYILGRMVEDMKENTLMIKNMDLVLIYGQMEENT